MSSQSFPYWLPYLMTIAAHVFYNIVNSCFKELTSVFTVFEVNYFMNGFTILLTSLYSFKMYDQMYVNVKSSIAFKMLCFRSLLSTASIMILLYNVSKIPLSFANSLHNLAPVIICFIEAVYNKTGINKNHFILTIISFVGVLLILRPTLIFGGQQMIVVDNLSLYVGLGVFGAVCYSFSYFLVKLMKKHIDNEKVILNYFYIFHSIVSSFFINFQKVDRPAIFETWMIAPAVILIVSLLIAQKLMYKSMYIGDPVLLMPFAYSGIIVSLLIDTFYFNYQIDFLDLLGVTLTSIGLISKILIK